MRTRKYKPNDLIQPSLDERLRLEMGMKAAWHFIHQTQRDVWDDFPSTQSKARSRPTLGFEGTLGNTHREGNVILINPFTTGYVELYNLLCEYYS